MIAALTPEFIMQLLLMLSAAAAVYGGIKSDLKHMRQDIERHGRAIGKAHARIDEILARD